MRTPEVNQERVQLIPHVFRNRFDWLVDWDGTTLIKVAALKNKRRIQVETMLIVAQNSWALEQESLQTTDAL